MEGDNTFGTNLLWNRINIWQYLELTVGEIIINLIETEILQFVKEEWGDKMFT